MSQRSGEAPYGNRIGLVGFRHVAVVVHYHRYVDRPELDV